MSMTLKRARKVLGKLAGNIPDEVLAEDIKNAEILKNLFFSNYKDINYTNRYNVTKHGKT